MDFLNVSLATATGMVAWLAQWLKAKKNIPTILTQLACLVVAFGLYAAGHWPPSGDGQWLFTGMLWALSANGVSSKLAALGLAPKTDSN